jgi:hypothetical protein
MQIDDSQLGQLTRGLNKSSHHAKSITSASSCRDRATSPIRRRKILIAKIMAYLVRHNPDEPITIGEKF